MARILPDQCFRELAATKDALPDQVILAATQSFWFCKR
jgi:hypothetical protein